MCVKRLLALSCIFAVATASEGGDFESGLHIFGKVVRQFISAQSNDVKISDGVHLVTNKINDARANTNDGSVLDMMENYLKSHEIRIRLPELMPEEGFGRAFKYAMEGFEVANETGTPRGGGGGGFGGGKKGGGGGGAIVLMGLMMGKMMAALGIGGVGLLAMKALMVSAMALMLSMIVGLKKLVSSGHDDGGHTVIHASPGYGGHGGGYDHRKKRAADMAYQSWSEYQKN